MNQKPTSKPSNISVVIIVLHTHQHLHDSTEPTSSQFVSYNHQRTQQPYSNHEAHDLRHKRVEPCKNQDPTKEGGANVPRGEHEPRHAAHDDGHPAEVGIDAHSGHGPAGQYRLHARR